MPSGTIKWAILPHRYGLVSDCDQYRIAKAIVPSGTVYSLYEGHTLVGRYLSADKAKQAAESNRQKNPGSLSTSLPG